MRLSTLTSIGLSGFAALASADAAPDYGNTAVCSGNTVTQTVTVTTGAAPPPVGPQTGPQTVTQTVTQAATVTTVATQVVTQTSTVTTMATPQIITQTVTAPGVGPTPTVPTAVKQDTTGYVGGTTDSPLSTSVVYGTTTASTLCPSAGMYAHPEKSGSSIHCEKPGWTTYDLPLTTVYAYASASGDSKKDCTVVIYQDITIIQVVVVDINVTIVNGYTSTVTVTKNTTASYTPPPPPVTTTSDAPGARKTLKVDVGGDQLIFNPNHVDAEVGDIVEFNFLKMNHTLTQSEFLTPCTYNGGFDTGFNQFNNGSQTLTPVQFEVKTKAPEWFYCRQRKGNHCGRGMVFGINAGAKMEQFILNAIAQNGDLTPTATASGTYGKSTNTPYKVTVGLGKGKILAFKPPFLPNVKRGEQILFDFRAVNHTLTESSLEKPCTKLNGTHVDTDFMEVNKNDTAGAEPFLLTIDTDGERYFYCRQGNGTPNGHCSKGMVFAINVDKQKFDQFQLAANATLPMRIKGRMPLS